MFPSLPFSAFTPVWTAVGWGMLHFLWLGAILWGAAIIGRGVLYRARPQARYLFSLWSLVVISATAVGTLAWSISAGERSAPPAWPALAGLPAGEWIKATMLPLLPAIWLGGASLLLILFVAGLAGTTRIRRRAREEAGDAAEACRRLASSLRLRRPVAVAVCPRLAAPILIGVLRPLIVLPAGALSTWTREQTEMVLLHELAHVGRRDYVIHLVQRLVESLLFFHPAVWAVSNWVRRDRELCCDELVLAHTGRPTEYAELLLLLAEASVADRKSAALAFGSGSLPSRIRYILQQEEPIMRSTVWSCSLPLAAAASLVAGLLYLSPPAVRPAFAAAPAGGAAETAEDGAEAPASEAGEEQQLLDPVLTQRAGESPLQTAGGKRAWGPEQAIGPPDTEGAGDIQSAWASMTPDGDKEWLICEFAAPLAAKAVVIHETYNPGSLYQVSVLDDDGRETVLWEGEDPTPRTRDRGVSVIPIKPEGMVRRVKIYFDSPAVPGWNEIDAVGLRGEEGETVWTAKVEASSTYATAEELPLPVIYGPADVQRFLKLEEEVKAMKEELGRLKKLEQDIEEIKRLLKETKE